MVTFARGGKLPELSDTDWWLAELRVNWGSAYIILFHAGQWTAERRDNHEVLTTGSAGELLTAIRDDYNQNPVPR